MKMRKNAPAIIQLGFGAVLCIYSTVSLIAFMSAARSIIMFSSAYGPDGFTAQRYISVAFLLVLMTVGVFLIFSSLKNLIKNRNNKMGGVK